MKNRKLNRLKEYDYSNGGYYFVTLNTENRTHHFGDIIDGKMILNNFGKLTDICWQEIPSHFPDIELDEYIIMPNHIHGIIIIDYKENQDLERENVNPKIIRNENIRSQRKTNLSSVIKGFKIGVTKISRKNDLQYFKWQRSFFDRIIRDEKELTNIRKYIKHNPIKWNLNKETIENINI